MGIKDGWKQIEGFETYEVSRLGEIRSKNKILKQTKNWSGRPWVTLYSKNRRVTCLVSHLVAKAFLPPRPDGYELDHKDNDKTNNQAINLQWLTHRENIAKRPTDNFARGERHGLAKLSTSSVKIIKSLFSIHTDKEIANRFGVSRPTIRDIRVGNTWKEVMP